MLADVAARRHSHRRGFDQLEPGDHFTKTEAAALHAILLGAAAHHVTVIGSSGDAGRVPTLGDGMVRSRRSAFRPPTRWFWALAAPFSPRIPRPAPTSARPPGQIRVAASATCMYAPPTRMASLGFQKRGRVPDVAGDAAEAGGMALVFTEDGRASLHSPPGTSNSAPTAGLWRWPTNMPIATSASSTPRSTASRAAPANRRAFHDITTDNTPGTNGYPATPGWEPVTGWETPNAQELIPLLARFAKPGTHASVSTASG